MAQDSVDRQFVSFDGGTRCSGGMLAADNATDLVAGQKSIQGRGIIPRGAGMSFAAASFGDDTVSIDTSRLDRILVLNQSELSVTIEAGTPVGGLLDFLIERGYYIPIVPGYPTITIGGCMASAVHGKNQLKDGIFSDQVLAFKLFHEEYGTLDVSPDREADIFDLTLGGFGLTGTILEATIKIYRLPSTYMDVVTEPVDNICDLPALLTDRARRSDFIISWHDFMQSGARFGSGFVQWGNFSSASHDTISGSASNDTANGATSHSRSIYPLRIEPGKLVSPLTLTAENRGNLSLPFYGHMTTGFMNALYNYSQMLTVGPPRQLPIELCFFPSKVLRDLYYHFFGKTGFFEHQAIIAPDRFADYVQKVHWWLTRNDIPVTIASSKMFDGDTRYLRFSGRGVCFALNFPRCARAHAFMQFLDELTLELEALPNIAKDSRLPLSVVRSTYREYDLFKSKLKSFDPRRRYRSELSIRLDL